MSSVDVPIVVPDTAPAPKDYEIPAAQEIAPLAVRALIDGTGAGSAFTPALQLIAPGGQVMWTAPTSETVAAGASADVSWFPRVGGGGGGSGGGGIQFDTKPQAGGFLYTETSGDDGTGFGTHIVDTNNGIWLESQWDMLVSALHTLTLQGRGAALHATGAGVSVVSSTNTFHIAGAAGTSDIGSSDQIVIAATNGLDFQSASGQIGASATLGYQIVSGADVVITLGTAGAKVQILDRLGAPLLEVREGGSYHIRTGTAWIADL